MKKCSFPDLVKAYTDIIAETCAKDLSGDNRKRFFEIGAWKTRLSGRELKFSEEERFQFQEKSGKLIFEVKNLNNDWKQWYKTMGDMVQDDQGYLLEYKKVWRRCMLQTGAKNAFIIDNEKRDKNTIEFVSYSKQFWQKWNIACSVRPALQNALIETSR